MALRYYRFFIRSPYRQTNAAQAASATGLSDHNEAPVELGFNLDEQPGIVRIAQELDGDEPSVSILCDSEEDQATLQPKLRQQLLDQGFLLDDDKLEVHELKQNNGPMHQHQCGHGCQHHTHDHSHDHHHNHNDDHHHDHAHDHHHHEHEHEHEHDDHWTKAGIGLVVGLILLGISLSGVGLPFAALIAINAISALTTLYLGWSVFKSAIEAIGNMELNMAVLYSISALAIVAVAIAGLFIPGLPVLVESAALVLGIWHLGEGIEHALVDEIEGHLDVRDCLPAEIALAAAPNSNEKKVSVKQLVPNDVIVVRKGQFIPADGTLLEDSELRTMRYNGAPGESPLKANEAVYQGMQVPEHIEQVKIRIKRPYQQSYLSDIAEDIKNASKKKSPIEETTQTILSYFVPGLLLAAAISGLAIGLLFPPALAIQCIIAIFVSACPCVLKLITPLASKIGMEKAAEMGVRFKSSSAIQSAGDIDTVVFDLNGTLTKGEKTVGTLRIGDQVIDSSNAEPHQELLATVALIEGRAKHPTGKTISEHIYGLGIAKAQESQTDRADDSCEEPEQADKPSRPGVKETIAGNTYVIGDRSMLAAEDIIASGDISALPPAYQDVNKGRTYIACNGKLVGQIELRDSLREDAHATIAALKKQNKTIYVCTGSRTDDAKAYIAAHNLDIDLDHVCGGMRATAEVDKERREEKASGIPAPGTKARFIYDLQQKGKKVAMVGDCTNDIKAITQANLGIAVRSKIADSNTEVSAGVVITEGLLSPVVTAFDVAEKTNSNILQNLFISLGYNSTATLVAGGALIALGFVLNPAIGIALVAVESAIVLGNLYRLQRQEIETIATMTPPMPSTQVDSANQKIPPRNTDAIGRSDLQHQRNSSGNTPDVVGWADAQRSPTQSPRLVIKP